MSSRRYYYKTLTFTFNSQDEIIHFLDLISRKIKVFQLYARTRGNRNVEIILLGDPAEIDVAISEIRKIAKTIKEMYRRDKGLATYDVRVILDYAKIEAAIPLDVAFKTLELLGYRVEQLKDGKIKTNAEFKKVVEVVEEISRLYKDMMEMDITPQAKRIIAMWCAVFDRTPEEAIPELEALGLVKKYITPERELVVLAYNYEEAYKRLKDFVDKFRENPEILDQLRKIVEEKILKVATAEEKIAELKRELLGEGRIIIKARGELPEELEKELGVEEVKQQVEETTEEESVSETSGERVQEGEEEYYYEEESGEMMAEVDSDIMAEDRGRFQEGGNVESSGEGVQESEKRQGWRCSFQQ